MKTLQYLENTTTYDGDEILWYNLLESSNKVLDLLADGGVQAEIG